MTEETVMNFAHELQEVAGRRICLEVTERIQLRAWADRHKEQISAILR